MKKHRLQEAYNYYNRKLTLLQRRKREIIIILEQLKQDIENGKQPSG